MIDYFSYQYSPPEEKCEWNSFGFLFKPIGSFDVNNLAEAINKTINDQLFPDLVVIQCMQNEFKKIRNACSGKAQHVVIEQSLSRMSTKTELVIAAYDTNAKCTSVAIVTKKNSAGLTARQNTLLEFLNDYSDEIMRAGLDELFSECHVKLEAPSGFTFIKPSGDKATVFLKTEEALTETERVQFLAFALLPRLAKRDAEFTKPIETIYIDSMAISSVAYALRDLYRIKHGETTPRIISFHSHDGLHNQNTIRIGRFLEHNTLCLISASTSQRLQRDWMKITSCSQDEVVTLLTIEDAIDANTALYRLRKDNSEEPEINDEYLRDIRIIGERFQPDQLQPKKIILREPCHKVQLTALARSLKVKAIFRTQVFKANATGATHPIFVSMDALIEEKSFRNWVDRILLQQVPASIGTLVVQQDPSSILLADLIKSRAKSLGLSIKWNQIFDDEIEVNASQVDKNKALLVVAGVIGKGTRLQSISRDLRDIHEGARLYVVGFQVAETHEQIKRLTQNLRFSAVKANIFTERFAEMAIGSSIADSYRNEHKHLNVSPLEIQSLFGRASKVAGSTIGMVADSFLPTLSGANLELRPDFAYWAEVKYKQSSEHAPWVLAMTASILQRAREEKSLKDEDRLFTSAFQHVVLDPENFSRYNDGIIQASILRAAYPSELDYRYSDELSDSVRIFLEKIFGLNTLNQGEAALEFALALRTKKLKLKKEHLEKIKNFLTVKGLTSLSQVLQGSAPDADLPI